MARRRVYIYRAPGGGGSGAADGAGANRGRDGREGGRAGGGAATAGRGAEGGAVGGAVKRRAGASGTDGAGQLPALELVLEEVPKWAALRQVLGEVQAQRAAWRRGEPTAEYAAGNSGGQAD
eukprot:361604-Chlamydomonas_euryale.AAC.1